MSSPLYQPETEEAGGSKTVTANPEMKLDRASEVAFISFFEELPEKHNDTIRLFERSGGDYYSAHGEDARAIANLVFHTSTVIKYLGGDSARGLATCTLSKVRAEGFLREHIKSKRVEIWGAADSRKSGGCTWQLIKRASPGNQQALESILTSENIVSPIVLAVRITTANDEKVKGMKRVGACFVDPTSYTIGFSEFLDNEILSNLESLIIQTGALECLHEDSKKVDYDGLKLTQVLTRCGIMSTGMKKTHFLGNNVQDDLAKLLEEQEGMEDLANRPEMEMKLALGACSAAIHYLRMVEDSVNFSRFRLQKHDLSQYMRLDGSAVNALNLVPEKNNKGPMSLFTLLNRCRTPQGSRLLNQWLKQPLVHQPAIEERLDLVQAMIEDSDLRYALHESHLKRVPDLHRLAKKFQRGSANLQDVIRIYQLVVKLPDLVACLQQTEQASVLKSVYIDRLEEYSLALSKLKELTETTVDLERADHHEYVVRPDFDPGLQKLAQLKLEVESELTPEHERMGRLLNIDLEKRLKLMTTPTHGRCLRVPRKDEALLRPHQSKIIHLATMRDGAYFTTTRLKALDDRLRELQAEYHQLQRSLIKEIIGIVGSYCTTLEHLNGLLAHLDLIVSFAIAAMNAPIPYARPKFTKDQLELKGARHPCLEAQPSLSFIPNDVSMKRGARDFLIITGPNMGGKSTYIRQIGCLAHLAQIGSFIPCDGEPQLPLFDSILARVGANDSLHKGISTFMAEMLETSTILRTATPRSLVIIDELGRGTSTNDGFGLAWAIAEYLLENVKCMSLFATHFHELTELAKNYQSVANLHVMVANNCNVASGGITLLYKIAEGICDQSFGIHVAQMAGFPSSILRLAKRKVQELEQSSNKSIRLPTSSMGEGEPSLKDLVNAALSNQPRDQSQQLKEVRDLLVNIKQRFSS